METIVEKDIALYFQDNTVDYDKNGPLYIKLNLNHLASHDSIELEKVITNYTRSPFKLSEINEIRELLNQLKITESNTYKLKFDGTDKQKDFILELYVNKNKDSNGGRIPYFTIAPCAI